MKPFSRFKMPVTTALPLVALATAAWGGPLRSPDRGLEQQTLLEDSRYMRDVQQRKSGSAAGDALSVDLSDPAQYRFVMNRLRGAGKTKENSPRLFERLGAARQKALAARAGGTRQQAPQAASLTDAWGCDHFIHQGRGTTASGFRTFQSNAWASCLNGASYVYADVVAYNSNYAETESLVVDSAAGEEFAAGQSFDDVVVQPSLPVGQERQLILDSMMIAMNEDTGEERVTYFRLQNNANTVAADLSLEHPRRAAPNSTKANTELCQQRGGLDCDYAAVQQNLTPSGGYTPWGVAMRNTANTTSWSAAAGHAWPVQNWNWSHIYVPVKLTFTAGSRNGVACVISEISPASKLRLVKGVTGGTCMSNADLTGLLGISVGTGTANVSAAIDLTRETPIAGTGVENCAPERIINQAVDFVITVSTKVKCGTAFTTPATATVRLKADARYGYGLMVWNSCMAEGTQVLRADGALLPVEQVKLGDKVVGGGGDQVLTVTDVSSGGEAEPLVVLRDDRGQEVRLTSKHPVILASGEARAAGRLRVADRVATREGMSTLTSVTRLPYTGKVYNLTLGTPEELARVGKGANTLFANGFRVGDNTMQGELSAPVADSRDVLQRLPAAWHKDFHRSAAFMAGQR